MNDVVNNIKDFLLNGGILGPIICCTIIVLESVIPIVPLSVFITLNYIFFGETVGFVLSWFFTVLGCCLSYYIFSHKVKGWFEKKVTSKDSVQKLMNVFDRLSFSQLVIIIAIPFTPAFAVNIVAGLSKIKFKKYLAAIMIGKISLVLFWGYIGTGLIESFKNPLILLYIGIMLVVAYFLSIYVGKRFNIK